jgi:hypothetical protein
MHRRQVGDGVEQALALAGAALGDVEVDDVGDSRLAAISKVVRVRVLFSKNRLNTLLPRSSGTFFTSRSLTLRKVPAVSRICVTTARGRPSIDSRWISSPWALSWGLRLRKHQHVRRGLHGEAEAAGRRRASDRRCSAGRHDGRGEGGWMGNSRPPRSTSTASVHAGRAAEVVELVDHGADGAAGVQHVVEQQDVAPSTANGRLVASARWPCRANRSRRGAGCWR